MIVRRALVGSLLALGVGLSGCGGSSHHGSPATSVPPTTTISGTTPTTENGDSGTIP